MKNKFYYEKVGECVSQVYELDATNWDDAKKEALEHIDVGDRIAECKPSAVKTIEEHPYYHYIAKNECENYATLQRGTWATREPSGEEYWEDYAYWYDDADETFFNGDGSEFTEWENDCQIAGII